MSGTDIRFFATRVSSCNRCAASRFRMTSKSTYRRPTTIWERPSSSSLLSYAAATRCPILMSGMRLPQPGTLSAYARAMHCPLAYGAPTSTLRDVRRWYPLQSTESQVTCPISLRTRYAMSATDIASVGTGQRCDQPSRSPAAFISSTGTSTSIFLLAHYGIFWYRPSVVCYRHAAYSTDLAYGPTLSPVLSRSMIGASQLSLLVRCNASIAVRPYAPTTEKPDTKIA
eukprot:3871891-Rhodomonas_salina.1